MNLLLLHGTDSGTALDLLIRTDSSNPSLEVVWYDQDNTALCNFHFRTVSLFLTHLKLPLPQSCCGIALILKASPFSSKRA